MLKTTTLTKLLKDLSHPDDSRRRSAAQALAEGDERVIYPLLKSLRDENAGVQEAAMRSLIAIGGEVVAYMVVPLLREDSYLRNTALIILQSLGVITLPQLYPLLKDKDDDVRKFALDMMTEIRDGVEPIMIVPLLKDTNANVRAAAAKALGVLSYEHAAEHLVGALDDEEWVAFVVLETLGELKDPETAPAICALLQSESPALRYAAIETLGMIGAANSIDPLIKYIATADGDEKSAAIRSLVQIGITPEMSAVSDDLLTMVQAGDWEERLIALRGLTDLNYCRAVGQIIDISGSLDQSIPEDEERLMTIRDALRRLDCPDEFVAVLRNPQLRFKGRVLASEVIGELGIVEAVPVLVEYLNHDMRDVRRACATALGKIDTPGSRAAMFNSVADHDSHIRRVAVKALGDWQHGNAFEMLYDRLKKEEFEDVLEDIVRALLKIDSKKMAARIDEFDSRVKEDIGRCSGDVDMLVRLSDDSALEVKLAALTGLGRVWDETAKARLVRALKDSDAEVRKTAVMSLGGAEEYLGEIKAMLKDPDMWVRANAVRAVGEGMREDTVNDLLPLLQDNQETVVLVAIEMLARIGGREAVYAISDLADRADGQIKEAAQQALNSL